MGSNHLKCVSQTHLLTVLEFAVCFPIPCQVELLRGQDSNLRLSAYTSKIPWSYSQWWLGHNPIRLPMEFMSLMVVSSSNSDTAFLCATSTCLSYPHTSHFGCWLCSKNTSLAAFWIEDLADCQFFLLPKTSPLVKFIMNDSCFKQRHSIPNFEHLSTMESFTLLDNTFL